MAQKQYSIHYEKLTNFCKLNKADFKHYLNGAHFEYAKVFGSAIYELKIKAFIEQFKIDKNMPYAIEVLSFYKSLAYIEKVMAHIGVISHFEQNPKDVFYILVYLVEHSKNEELKNILFYRSFLFYLFSINKSTNIEIDHKKMSLSLLKTSYKDITLKESFGEKDGSSYFCVKLSSGLEILENGSSIKTLRKKGV